MPQTGVRLNLSDTKRIKDFLSACTPGERDAITSEVLERTARACEERAKLVEIVRGRGLDSEPLDDQLTYRSGHLTRSISTDSDPTAGVWIVGTPVVYGPVHELGLTVAGRRYPVRKFLEPAADWVIENRTPEFFQRALERARGSA
jgi:hypothetical protein